MWLPWLFLGLIGGHRYYLGDIGKGIAMTLTLGGLGFWALADAFFITKSLEAKNAQLEMGILDKVKRLRQSST
jgi:TM2 domain-containing membrane protein YozV